MFKEANIYLKKNHPNVISADKKICHLRRAEKDITQNTVTRKKYRQKYMKQISNKFQIWQDYVKPYILGGGG